MNKYSEEKFDLLVEEVQSGRLSRREFFRRCALVGVSLTTVVQVLEATKALAAAPTEFPPNWNPYPFKWGTSPIADNPDDAIKWYLERMKDSAVPDTDPSVVLTEDEIKQLKVMKPKVGHSWYALAVPAIAGWNSFWKSESVSKWAGDIVVYDNQAKPERMLLGTQFLIDQGRCLLPGSLAFDWILFGGINEAISRGQDRHLTSVATSSFGLLSANLHLHGRRRYRVSETRHAYCPVLQFERLQGDRGSLVGGGPSVLV